MKNGKKEKLIFTKGFTLIELLVVIAIIGILSSVVLASLNTAKSKGNDAKRASDLRAIQTALELYAVTNNKYPVTVSWSSRCAAFSEQGGGNVIPGLIPTYLPKFPDDPQMNAAASTCCYVYSSNGSDYKLLDHSCGTANYKSIPGLIDPTRDGGTNACIVDGTGIWSWAVYTTNACAW